MQELSTRFFEEAKADIFTLLDNKLPDNYTYHNLNHTIDVIENAQRIGQCENLDDKNTLILKICALFHDVGYLYTYYDHEIKSAWFAREYLFSKNVDEKIIQTVVKAILATKIPQSPHNLISEILCDADLLYLSEEKKYFEKAELLRKEWNAAKDININKSEFHVNSLKFYKTHNYHTNYGKTILQKNKELTRQMILDRVS